MVTAGWGGCLGWLGGSGYGGGYGGNYGGGCSSAARKCSDAGEAGGSCGSSGDGGDWGGLVGAAAAAVEGEDDESPRAVELQPLMAPPLALRAAGVA